MRIDLDYMASILNLFLESENAHIDFNDFEQSSIQIEENGKLTERFVFHLQLAIDNQLFGKRNGYAHSLKDIGISQSLDGLDSICIMPIRLTQTGHDFASSLNNKEVITRLKSEFKDAPFKVVFEGGQKLLHHIMIKKLNDVLE